MAFSRTRIWRGGVEFSASPPETQSAPESANGVPASDARAGAPELPPQHPAPPATEPAGGAALAPAVRELAATRCLPIEQLFPGQHAAARPAEVPVEIPFEKLEADLWKVETKPGLGARLRKTRRAQRLALALGLTLGLSVLRLLASGAGHERAGTRPETQAAAAHTPTAHAQSAPPEAPASARSATETSGPDRTGAALPGLERAAIDALIAGDGARAEQLYRRLTHAGGASAAAHEALRILVSPARLPGDATRAR